MLETLGARQDMLAHHRPLEIEVDRRRESGGWQLSKSRSIARNDTCDSITQSCNGELGVSDHSGAASDPQLSLQALDSKTESVNNRLGTAVITTTKELRADVLDVYRNHAVEVVQLTIGQVYELNLTKLLEAVVEEIFETLFQRLTIDVPVAFVDRLSTY